MLKIIVAHPVRLQQLLLQRQQSYPPSHWTQPLRPLLQLQNFRCHLRWHQSLSSAPVTLRHVEYADCLREIRKQANRHLVAQGLCKNIPNARMTSFEVPRVRIRKQPLMHGVHGYAAAPPYKMPIRIELVCGVSEGTTPDDAADAAAAAAACSPLSA